jgi:CheY-like chemotaxis protein
MTLGSRVPATVLLVDDDLEYLELRAQFMKAFGFSVVTAPGPIEAISIVAKAVDPIKVAVVDYQMPVMNGCLLADRLKSMRPELKIILHSGAVIIPENQMTNIDVFISKCDEIARLIASVSEHTTAIGKQSGLSSQARY